MRHESCLGEGYEPRPHHPDSEQPTRRLHAQERNPPLHRLHRRDCDRRKWAPPVVGTQWVQSWHGSIGNAQKALGGINYVSDNGNGHKMEIRTDIKVRETVKRAKKVAS